MHKDDFIKNAINKMMEIAGYNARFHHLIQMGEYPWYSEYTWTQDESNRFKQWFLGSFSKNFKHLKYRVEKEYVWFDFMWGLKVV